MAWIYLIIASIFEIGWPIGLKMAQTPEFTKYFWILAAIIAMIMSGMFLYLAQKQIPIGTAYAVWTGIGMIGTFIAGIIFFQEVSDFARFFGVILVLSGIIILKVCH